MVLVSLDAKGKIRVVDITLYLHDDPPMYSIRRNTGLLGGKMISQPDICISKGKVKRTLLEQATLQFDSEVKKYKDKGYKELPKNLNEMTSEEIQAIVGSVKSDQSGFAKHMLAKQIDSVKPDVVNKVKFWYASRKLDGVRCSLYFKDGKIHSASRGGGNYDIALSDFISNQKLISFFSKYPDIVLDGEAYKHGKTLMEISGEMRREEVSHWIEYYVYDVMIPNIKFSERLEKLEEISAELSLSYQPEKDWEDNDLRIQMLPQVSVRGLDNINKLHDQYVAEGFEGCVIRNPESCYGFGKRSNDMLKVKRFSDREDTIIDIVEGLRDEDMCFLMETNTGIQYKAKPMGDRATKQAYRNNINAIKGKKGTVKYFYLSEDGVPQLPVFKCVRNCE